MYTPIGVLSGRNLERKVYGRDAGRSSSNQECTYLWRDSDLSITTSPESLMAPGQTPEHISSILKTEAKVVGKMQSLCIDLSVKQMNESIGLSWISTGV